MIDFEERREEMEDFLSGMSLGVLCLSSGDEPYGIPINHAYVDGRLLLHCSHVGKKIDVLKENPRVCFVVATQSAPVKPHETGEVCHIPSMSVICYGKARIVEDLEERTRALNDFLRHYAPGAPALPEESVRACACIEIAVEEMTGRREGPAKKQVACWRWRFQSPPL